MHAHVQVALLLFLTLSLCLVTSFLAYQLWLVLRGMTTYEMFKWREVQRRLLAEQTAEPQDGASDRVRRGKGRGRQHDTMPVNMYDRGAWLNFLDAVMPLSWPGRRRGSQGAVKKHQ